MWKVDNIHSSKHIHLVKTTSEEWGEGLRLRVWHTEDFKSNGKVVFLKLGSRWQGGVHWVGWSPREGGERDHMVPSLSVLGGRDEEKWERYWKEVRDRPVWEQWKLWKSCCRQGEWKGQC